MIDIVVPTYGQERYTVACFKSVAKHTADFNYRVVWVDNGSTAESRAVVMREAIPLLKSYRSIWLESNLGFVKATNIGITNGESEFVVLLNNDTEVTKGWLSNLLHPFHGDERISVTGPLTNAVGSWQNWRNVKAKMLFDMPVLDESKPDEVSDILSRMYAGKHRRVSMLAFFCSVFRRSVFKEIGLLDTAFGAGLGDDDDYCERIRKVGGNPIFCPSAFVYHHHRTTFKSLYSPDDIINMQKVNMAKYKAKHKIN